MGKTIIFFNPGAGRVNGDPTEAQASANMPALLDDAGVSEAIFERLPEQDRGEGRYTFRVTLGERSTEVRMPGLPLAMVQYTGAPEQNIWYYPRLYVDGSSFVWLYAISHLRRVLTDSEFTEE